MIVEIIDKSETGLGFDSRIFSYGYIGWPHSPARGLYELQEQIWVRGLYELQEQIWVRGLYELQEQIWARRASHPQPSWGNSIDGRDLN